jgi:hypothetical protein
MIVVDGLIMFASVVGNPDVSISRIWIPSPIDLIASGGFYGNKQL